MKIINLDQATINALEFFKKNPPKKITLKNKEFPFVVGSGNAYNTANILFAQTPAIIDSESNFKETILNYKPLIQKGLSKEAIIISASGEKDSIWETKLAKKTGLKTTLITCNKNSSAALLADKVESFKKIPEPYTYNVSTYMAMILASTGEKADYILKQIKKIKIPKNFKNYEAYSFILPDKYQSIAPMLEIKQRELFGSKINIKAFSQGEARHAKYVIPWKKELVISIGEKNKYFGDKNSRWDIKLSKNHDYAYILALTYYIMGKIQEVKPDYFKKNIKNYTQDYGPKAYGKNKAFDVIVPGNEDK
ncbi:hypothetical protein K9M50_01155 [Patescibacteria group bacterium]|nr:hypothetical protein [Patescibacteria group bacterium]